MAPLSSPLPLFGLSVAGVPLAVSTLISTTLYLDEESDGYQNSHSHLASSGLHGWCLLPPLPPAPATYYIQVPRRYIGTYVHIYEVQRRRRFIIEKNQPAVFLIYASACVRAGMCACARVRVRVCMLPRERATVSSWSSAHLQYDLLSDSNNPPAFTQRAPWFTGWIWAAPITELVSRTRYLVPRT